MILDKEGILENTSVENLNTPNEYISHDDEVHERDCVTQNEWLLQNVPFIETPDTLLDKVYYFRWKNLLACLSKRREDGKYEFCESAPGSYYHKYIDCAQGAHVRDARWIKNRKYLNDYIDLTPSKEAYWNYLADSVWQKYLIDSDKDSLDKNFEKLLARFSSRDNNFDRNAGLYFTKGDNEGQEAGVGCFDFVERELSYKATHTSRDSRVEALFDNKTSGEYWSCYGSGNRFDAVEIACPFEDFYLTSLRLWFRVRAKSLKVYYRCDGEWLPVQNLQITPFKYDGAMTEITFEKVHAHGVRVEFENLPEKNEYTSLFELVVCYNFEPWGSDSFWKVIGGENTYRISSNTFMTAAAFALSKMAEVLGRPEKEELLKRGEALKKSIFEKLWNKDEHFFDEVTLDGKRVVGKESVGLAPWSFLLPSDDEGFAKAWEYSLDEGVFLSKFGITSLEKKSPHYLQPFIHGCLWNGPVWPYTFSLILCGMANLLHDYRNHGINKEDYFELIKRYALCHFDNFSESDLVLREDHHPEENHWIAQAREYNHSTFIDNILSGLLGVRPEEDVIVIDPIVPDSWDYLCVEDISLSGCLLTLVYDKTGRRYNKGQGFKVFINGKEEFSFPAIQRVEIKKR